MEIADRLIDSLTRRFFLLAKHPNLGRARDEDLSSGIRSFPVGRYVILYRIEGDDILILRVLRGSRNIKMLSAKRLPYLPMQNVEKIRFRISSAVVAPVMASSGRSAA